MSTQPHGKPNIPVVIIIELLRLFRWSQLVPAIIAQSFAALLLLMGVMWIWVSISSDSYLGLLEWGAKIMNFGPGAYRFESGGSDLTSLMLKVYGWGSLGLYLLGFAVRHLFGWRLKLSLKYKILLTSLVAGLGYGIMGGATLISKDGSGLGETVATFGFGFVLTMLLTLYGLGVGVLVDKISDKLDPPQLEAEMPVG